MEFLKEIILNNESLEINLNNIIAYVLEQKRTRSRFVFQKEMLSLYRKLLGIYKKELSLEQIRKINYILNYLESFL